MRKLFEVQPVVVSEVKLNITLPEFSPLFAPVFVILAIFGFEDCHVPPEEGKIVADSPIQSEEIPIYNLYLANEL